LARTTIFGFLIVILSLGWSDAQNGWTPLITAAYFCQLKVVEVLLNNNCSIELQNKVYRLKRIVFMNRLKLSKLSEFLSSLGSEFQTVGPA